MEHDEYRKMYELEDFYWWFAGRRHLVRRILAGFLAERRAPGRLTILDAGCGTGAGLDNIESFGTVVGADAFADALEFCRRRGKGRLLHTSLEEPGIASDSVDVVTMLDVLEHIDDDRAALRSLFRVLRPGGKLLLTVPAYPFLWSDHDVALHHKRRYVAADLTARVREAGFLVRRRSGLVASFLPMIVVFRLLQKLRPSPAPAASFVVLPPALNALFRVILVGEVELSRLLPLPFGSTIYLVAEKPAAARA